MSGSRLMVTRASRPMARAFSSALPQQEQSLFEVEGRRDAGQRQAELHHREGHVGLDPDDDRVGAAQLHHLRQRFERTRGERIEHIERLRESLNLDPAEIAPDRRLSAPSVTNPMGTDEVGRDILSRIVYGARVSIIVGFAGVLLSGIMGTFLGVLAGYFGGKIDAVIMRVTDIFLAVPPLILALAVASVLQPSLWHGMLAVSLMWWPWYTRLVYGVAVALKSEYFVTAAEVTGASDRHILFKEMLPNTLSPVLTKMSIDIAWVIIIGAMLSYVGLGVQPPEPSLGTMISDGARYLPDQWWIVVFPALALLTDDSRRAEFGAAACGVRLRHHIAGCVDQLHDKAIEIAPIVRREVRFALIASCAEICVARFTVY